MLKQLVERTRRNHGLEHATLHVLSEQKDHLVAAGRATPNGFYLYGNLEEGEIDSAANEAIRRMNAGHRRLAVHPGCGTNLVTAGFVCGALSLLGVAIGGKRAPWHVQLSNAILGAMLGAFLARPLGPWMQANVTTSADMQGAEVRRITRNRTGRLVTHFVETNHHSSIVNHQ
jgi:hypothetical protein